MLRRNSSISSFPTSTDHFGRIITKADLERIQSVWMGACEMAGLTLNKAVYAEFSKRITKAKRSKGEKSKLDLSNCAINDKMLILLLETLSVGPVLAKLDLHGNDISNEGATCLVKLLNGQIQLARRFAVDERLHACFLGEVNLANNKRIDPQLLNQIADLCEALRWVNAQAHIREIYQEAGSPDIIFSDKLQDLWVSIVGRFDRDSLSQACKASRVVAMKSMYSYEESEAILLQGIVLHGNICTPKNELVMLLRTPENGNNAVHAADTTACVSPPPNTQLDYEGEEVIPQSLSNRSISFSSDRLPSHHEEEEVVEQEEEEELSLMEAVVEQKVNDFRQVDHEDKVSLNLSLSSIASVHSATQREDPPPPPPPPPPAPAPPAPAPKIDSEVVISTLATPPRGRSLPSSTTALLPQDTTTTSSKTKPPPPPAAATTTSTSTSTSSPAAAPRRFSSTFRSDSRSPEKTYPPPPPPATTAATTTTTTTVAPVTAAVSLPKSSSKVPPKQRATASEVDDYLSSKRKKQEEEEEGGVEESKRSTATSSSTSAKKAVPAVAGKGSAAAKVFDRVVEQQEEVVQEEEEVRLSRGGRLSYSARDRNIIHSTTAFDDPPSRIVLLPLDLSEKQQEEEEEEGYYLSSSSSLALNMSHKQLTTSLTVNWMATLRFTTLRVLSLRNNNITTLLPLRLPAHFPSLVDLDLGYNQLSGSLGEDVLPRQLERVDLSHNRLVEVRGLLLLLHLREVDLSDNTLRRLDGLPPSVEKVYLEKNQLVHAVSLRSLALCPAVCELCIAGNPVLATLGNVKAFVKSLFPKIAVIDGVRVIPEKRGAGGGGGGGGSRPPPPAASKSSSSSTHRGTTMSASKSRQVAQDKARSDLAGLKAKVLQETRVALQKEQEEVAKRRTSKMRPGQIAGVVNRLYPKSPDKKASTTSSSSYPAAAATPARLFSTTPAGRSSSSSSFSAKPSRLSYSGRATTSRGGSNGAGGGGGGSSDEVLLEEWLANAAVERARLAAAFRLAFSLAQRLAGSPSWGEEAQEEEETFQLALRRVAESRSTELSLPLRRVLEIYTASSSSTSSSPVKAAGYEKAQEVLKAKAVMEKSAGLLQEVQTSLLLAREGEVDFNEAMQLIMKSRVGVFVEEELLLPYDCCYHPPPPPPPPPPIDTTTSAVTSSSSPKGKASKTPSPKKSKSPSKPLAGGGGGDDFVHHFMDVSLGLSSPPPAATTTTIAAPPPPPPAAAISSSSSASRPPKRAASIDEEQEQEEVLQRMRSRVAQRFGVPLDTAATPPPPPAPDSVTTTLPSTSSSPRQDKLPELEQQQEVEQEEEEEVIVVASDPVLQEEVASHVDHLVKQSIRASQSAGAVSGLVMSRDSFDALAFSSLPTPPPPPPTTTTVTTTPSDTVPPAVEVPMTVTEQATTGMTVSSEPASAKLTAKERLALRMKKNRGLEEDNTATTATTTAATAVVSEKVLPVRSDSIPPGRTPAVEQKVVTEVEVETAAAPVLLPAEVVVTAPLPLPSTSTANSSAASAPVRSSRVATIKTTTPTSTTTSTATLPPAQSVGPAASDSTTNSEDGEKKMTAKEKLRARMERNRQQSNQSVPAGEDN